MVVKSILHLNEQNIYNVEKISPSLVKVGKLLDIKEYRDSKMFTAMENNILVRPNVIYFRTLGSTLKSIYFIFMYGNKGFLFNDQIRLTKHHSFEPNINKSFRGINKSSKLVGKLKRRYVRLGYSIPIHFEQSN